MTRYLTLLMAAATLSLASCASTGKSGACCSDGCKTEAPKKAAACCDSDKKGSAHKH